MHLNKLNFHLTAFNLWRWCELQKYKFWMETWSSQWLLQFKQLQLNPKKFFGTSTEFELIASALALQCSTIWAMRTYSLERVQFVEFILTHERNETWRWCELWKDKFRMKIWTSQWLLQFKQLQINLKKNFRTSMGFELPWPLC